MIEVTTYATRDHECVPREISIVPVKPLSPCCFLLNWLQGYFSILFLFERSVGVVLVASCERARAPPPFELTLFFLAISFKLSTSINIGLESPISSSLSIEASRTSRLTVATCFPRTSTVYWPAIGSRVSTYTSAYALVHPSIAIPNNVRLVQTLSGRVRAAEVSKKQSFVDIMDSSDSRIPEASFGTAEEDALRRDFTLNALFFNVNDGKIEDMTGRYCTIKGWGEKLPLWFVTGTFVDSLLLPFVVQYDADRRVC